MKEEQYRDIAKEDTQPLTAMTLTAKKESPLDQHKDITSIAGNAVLAGTGDFMNGIVRYATNVLMTHMVAPNVYGIFGEVYTAVTVLGWIAKLGLDGALIRLLPAYRVTGRQDLVEGLSRFTIWLTLISGTVIGSFVFFFAPVVARLFYHNSSYELPLQEVSLLIPLTALQWVLSVGLQSYKEIKWKIYVDRLSQPVITLITLVIFFYLLGLHMGALCISAISGYFCSVIIGQIALSKILKRDAAHYTRPVYAPRIWLHTSIPTLFNGMMSTLSNSADVLFLGVFATSTQAAIYIAADRISSLVGMPLLALNIIFAPIMAEYSADKKYEQLASMFKLVTKWSLSLSIPVFLACVVFHDAILGIFGSQYTSGGLALIILCIGNMVNAGTGSVLQMVFVAGRLRLSVINNFVVLSINAALSLILVPRFHVIGAALAAALAVVIANVLSLIEVHWTMRIHPYRWDVCKPLIAGGVACAIGFAMVHFIRPGPGRFASIEQLALLIPFAFVYCLVLALQRFSKEDKIVLDAVLARISNKRQ